MKFKLFSTEVTISFLFICLVAICLVMNMFKSFLLCMSAIIIHEAGHLVPMYIFGCFPKKIKISMFEIKITDDFRNKRTPRQNFLIIFFGPFVNFICFIASFLLYLLGNAIFLEPAIANASVCVFNMLPVLSLDGGQLVYILLCKRFCEATAEKSVNIMTFIILFPLSALGFLLLFNSQYNFSLLFVCVYLVMSLVCRNNRYY